MCSSATGITKHTQTLNLILISCCPPTPHLITAASCLSPVSASMALRCAAASLLAAAPPPPQSAASGAALAWQCEAGSPRAENQCSHVSAWHGMRTDHGMRIDRGLCVDRSMWIDHDICSDGLTSGELGSDPVKSYGHGDVSCFAMVPALGLAPALVQYVSFLKHFFQP